MENLEKINKKKSFINFFEGTTKFWQFQLLDMIKGYLHSKFHDIPCSGLGDIKKNMPKKGKKMMYFQHHHTFCGKIDFAPS